MKLITSGMLTTHPRLYKKTATGALQVWWMERKGDRHRTQSGKFQGAVVTSTWTVCTPKNTGRANATTPEEQAEREVAAEYTKKRKDGYQDTPGAAQGHEHFRPMLAYPFGDYKGLGTLFADHGYVFSQPKLDGIRCIARQGGLWSRKGNRIVSAPHVEAALAACFLRDPELVFDGELYSHELCDDFDTISSVVRTSKMTQEDVERSQELMSYWVYDLAVPGDFSARSRRLRELVPTSRMGSVGVVVYTPTIRVENRTELDAIYDDYLERGFEGQIVRLDTEYQNKRTWFLLKRKEWIDEEFPVVEVCEGKGNRSGMAGFARLRLKDGRTFKANIKGTREFLREVLARAAKLCGKQATVCYHRLTPKGRPKHPRIKAFHETPRL